MKINGLVSAVKQREKGYSVKIGIDWFSGFGECPTKKGDSVEIEYKEDGQWKNITDIKVTILGLQTADTYTPKEQKDYRLNVDAGNLLQREIDLLGLLPEAERNKSNLSLLISDGKIGEYLVNEFTKIRNLLRVAEDNEKAVQGALDE